MIILEISFGTLSASASESFKNTILKYINRTPHQNKHKNIFLSDCCQASLVTEQSLKKVALTKFSDKRKHSFFDGLIWYSKFIIPKGIFIKSK